MPGLLRVGELLASVVVVVAVTVVSQMAKHNVQCLWAAILFKCVVQLNKRQKKKRRQKQKKM